MSISDVQLDRLGSRVLVQPLLDFGLIPTTPAIPILMYHSISSDAEPGVGPYYRLTTTPARFREQMQWLKDCGYAVIDIPEALRRLDSGSKAGPPAVVLTFDDGFHDFFTHAWPVLDEFGFTATMFLPTAFIGSERRSFNGRRCLTWCEVRELRSCGVSFGAHTVSHPVLHRLSYDEVRREIGDSRARIEYCLQERVTAFAYPYAFPQEDRRFVAWLRQELVALGFESGVTTAIGRAKRGQDPMVLKRLPVNDCDDLGLFSTKLAGGYDWMCTVQLLSRAAKKAFTR